MKWNQMERKKEPKMNVSLDKKHSYNVMVKKQFMQWE